MSGGTLKIFFTGEDLARLRIASRVDELWETAMSLHVLQGFGRGDALAGWRRRARVALAETSMVKQVRETLVPLLPLKAYFPDFLTPYEGLSGLDNGIAALADTPPSRVRHEVDQLRPHVPVPATLDDLARGNQRSIRDLADLSATYWQTVFASQRLTMEHSLGRERASLTRLLTDHGVETMLAAASAQFPPPMTRSTSPVPRRLTYGGRNSPPTPAPPGI